MAKYNKGEVVMLNSGGFRMIIVSIFSKGNTGREVYALWKLTIDYEFYADTAETMVQLDFCKMMLNKFSE